MHIKTHNKIAAGNRHRTFSFDESMKFEHHPCSQRQAPVAVPELAFGIIALFMKFCPHCGKEVRFWRVWQTGTIYQCPSCGKYSRIAWVSQILFALIVPLPTLVLALGLLIYFDVQSWVMRICLIVPIAFAASLLMKYLLARFGRFQALDMQQTRRA